MGTVNRFMLWLSMMQMITIGKAAMMIHVF
jgi:hypothetical protein